MVTSFGVRLHEGSNALLECGAMFEIRSNAKKAIRKTALKTDPHGTWSHISISFFNISMDIIFLVTTASG